MLIQYSNLKVHAPYIFTHSIMEQLNTGQPILNSLEIIYYKVLHLLI